MWVSKGEKWIFFKYRGCSDQIWTLSWHMLGARTNSNSPISFSWSIILYHPWLRCLGAVNATKVKCKSVDDWCLIDTKLTVSTCPLESIMRVFCCFGLMSHIMPKWSCLLHSTRHMTRINLYDTKYVYGKMREWKQSQSENSSERYESQNRRIWHWIEK